MVDGIEQSPAPRLTEVIRQALESRLARVHVCMPGRITAWSPSTCLADVQPCLKENSLTVGGETTTTLPVIPDVPVAFPRASSARLTFPLAVGDYVRLVFCERSLHVFRGAGGTVDPLDLRKHDLSDAIADASGVWPDAEALNVHAQNIVLGFVNGAELHLKPGGLISLGSETPLDFVALASLVLARLNAIEISFNTHTHAFTGAPVVGPPPGLPPLGTASGSTVVPTVLAGVSTTVASTKVRSE